MTRALFHRATIITVLLATVPIMTVGSVWHWLPPANKTNERCTDSRYF